MYRQGWNRGWKLTGLWGRSFGWQASRKGFWIYFRKKASFLDSRVGVFFFKKGGRACSARAFPAEIELVSELSTKGRRPLDKKKKGCYTANRSGRNTILPARYFPYKKRIGVLENVKSRFSRRDRNRISEKYCKPALRETKTALPDFSLIPIFGSNIRKRVLGGFEKAGWKSGLCLAFRRGLLRISKHPERRTRID